MAVFRFRFRIEPMAGFTPSKAVVAAAGYAGKSRGGVARTGLQHARSGRVRGRRAQRFDQRD